MSQAAPETPKGIRKVNVLALILITICACAVSFLSKQTSHHIIFTLLLFVLMAALGFGKSGFKFLMVYFVSELWLFINVHFQIAFPSPMVFTLIIELIPILMPAYLLIQAPSGKLTAGLRQLPIPANMKLIIIVILRFMPTMAAEFSDVKDAMRTRGFLKSPVQIVMHPLSTLEYAIVPMVFRSLKTADELASSCIVRGIESPYKKQGYYLNEMHIKDVLLMAVFLGIAAVFIIR